MRYALLVVLIVVFFQVKAQQFGGNPPSLRFSILKTDTVNILFPKGLEKEAREILSISNNLIRNPPAPLGFSVKPINVVLQNLPVRSNAYVSLAPRRSEYFMRPYFTNHELSSIPWHQVLAVHETRHVHQFDVFNAKIPRILSYFLGQQGAALGMNAAIPDWFWEGDAVWQESVVTPQGRGRLPFFFNGYRSLWLQNKEYNYQKLRNGSFRHFIPNHYQLGYLLVYFGRKQFGDSIWRKVTGDAIAFKGIVYPFQQAVKRHTGLSYKKFVDSAFTFYQEEMGVSNLQLKKDEYTITNPHRNNVLFYQFPHYLPNGNLLSLQESYRHIPGWIEMDSTGRKLKRITKDIDVESYYSSRRTKVVYTAFKPDVRWGWREYSNIKILDLQTGKRKKITTRSRLFMPDLSPDEQTIVAVSSETNQTCQLQLINVSDKSIKSFPNPNYYIYTYPKFSFDGSKIFSAVRNNQGEMAIIQTDCATAEEKILLPFANTPVSYLHITDKFIFYSSPSGLSDQLFKLNLNDLSVTQMEGLPNGNYQASYNTSNDKLVWNTWTADGLLLQEKRLNTLKFHERSNQDPLKLLFAKDTIGSLFKNVLNEIQPGNIESTPYRQGLHLLNIHSWRPRFIDPDYGLTLYSDNVLNTFTGELGYNYNRNETSHQLSAAMLYGGLYPFLRAEISQTWNRSFALNADTLITWNQQGMNAGFILPFNLTGGRNFRNLSIRANIHSDRIQYTGLAKTIYADDRFQYYSSSISWVQQSQKAIQQIYPRWAHTFFLQHRHTLSGIKGNQLLLNASVYLPGLLNNHSLVLFASYQGRDTLRGSRFANSISFSRGYNPVNFPRSTRFSVNYHFPLLYPEFGVGQIIYLLRIRSNLFYDHLEAKSLRTGRRFPFRSAGVELFFDTRFWNQIPMSFGVRYSRLLDNDLLQPGRNPNQFELIVPLDLF